jgi:hypothetical protein
MEGVSGRALTQQFIAYDQKMIKSKKRRQIRGAVAVRSETVIARHPLLIPVIHHHTGCVFAQAPSGAVTRFL